MLSIILVWLYVIVTTYILGFICTLQRVRNNACIPLNTMRAHWLPA